MNNLSCLTSPEGKPTRETSSAGRTYSYTLPDNLPPDKEAIVRQSKQSDAGLFSTYEPVNHKSILPVHQLLF